MLDFTEIFRLIDFNLITIFKYYFKANFKFMDMTIILGNSLHCFISWIIMINFDFESSKLN